MLHKCLRCNALHQDMVMSCSCGGNAFAVKREEPADASGSDAGGTYDINLKVLLDDGNVIDEPEEGKFSIDLARCLRK